MDDTRVPTTEQLMAEMAWVRRLARALAKDAALADDIAQDTWLIAAQQQPSADRPLRPWLARVVTNLVRVRRTSDVRRDRRHAAVADDRTVPSPAELLERVELQRAVADEVIALAEPYRSTLLLHFFEGYGSAEIARRLEIPDGTVRRRLKVALDRVRDALRKRTDQPKGGWLAALVPFARLPAPASAAVGSAVASKEALLAMKATKLVVVSLVLVLAAGIVWHWRSSAPRSLEDHSGETSSRTAVSTPGATATAPGRDVGSPHVRKLANREMRTKLVQAIRAAHEQRISKARTSAAAALLAAPRTQPGSAADDADADDPDNDYIREAMTALLPLVIDCYKQARVTHPALAGVLVVNFTIEGEPGIGGVITESAIDLEKSEIKDPDLGQCVEETMFALEIDPPANGGTVRVTFPFTFRPKG